MVWRLIRISLILAVLVAIMAQTGEGARFGDRLLPRVPLHYSGRSASNLVEAEPEARVARKIDHEERPEPRDIFEPPPAATLTEAHRLEMSTEYFAVPERPPTAIRTPPAPIVQREPPPDRSTPPAPAPAPAPTLRPEPWAAPVLALALASMTATAGFEAFAVYMTRRSASIRRQAFLGRALISGLFGCAAVAASLTATPTAFTCGAMRFGAGVACAVVFAALLVKCVFLVSLDGGVYLPAAYQALLLFFASLIQVTIGAQWLGLSPPRVVGVAPPLCRASLKELLLSLSYVIFLIASVAALALKSRGIRDNYREARHIGAAAACSCAAWLGWVSAALATPERHRDACLAAGLLATAAAVFVPMFAPEARRLASASKDDRPDADLEDRNSASSPAASGYSPSFFHFKPVKYGVVGVPPPAPAPAQEPKETPTLPTTQPPSGRCLMMWPAGARYWNGWPPPPRGVPGWPAPTRETLGWQYALPVHLYPPPPVRTHLTHPSHMPHALPYHCFMPPAPPGVLMRTDDNNVFTTLEPTFSSNPNVYFHRNEGGVHPGMMY